MRGDGMTREELEHFLHLTWKHREAMLSKSGATPYTDRLARQMEQTERDLRKFAN